MKLEAFRDNEFFLKWIEKIPTKYRHVNICKFIETNRYLPSNVSHLAGHYSFSIFPMHEEILNCMDPNSNVRDVTVMKGVQTDICRAPAGALQISWRSLLLSDLETISGQ